MSDILFTGLAGSTVPSGTNAVQTVGYSQAGRGGALYAYDASVDSTFVTAHPRIAFRAADGRGFRLAEPVWTPEMFGAAGDGSTNDTDAFAAVSDAASLDDAATIEMRPGALYVVGGAANQPYVTPPVDLIYNWPPTVPFILDFAGCGSVVLRGNGATMQNAAGGRYGTFESDGSPRSPDTAPYLYPEATGVAAPYLAMIRLEGCGNVEVRDLILDGNIENTTIGGQYGNVGIQIQMCGLYAHENIGPVSIVNVVSRGHGEDGFDVDEQAEHLSSDATTWRMTGCEAWNNGRQGLSLTAGNGLLFDECKFNETGHDSGGVASPPASGVDIEAEHGSVVRNIVFRRCEFLDNEGVALDVDSGDSGEITFEDCKFRRGYGGDGFVLWLNKPGLRFYRCTILGTSVWMWNGGDYPTDAVLFSDCLFSNNPARSPTGNLYTNGYGQLFNGGAAHVTFRRCKIEHAVNATAYNGNLDAMRFEDCTVTATTGAIFLYGRFAGSQTAFVEADGQVATSPEGIVSSTVSCGEAEDLWSFRRSSTTTVYAATVDRQTGDLLNADTRGDADVTLTPGTDRRVQRFTATLTANRSVTLATTGAKRGSRFRIVRTGGGSFNLNVGSGPLKALVASTWCEVEFDGSSWNLTAYGAL